MKEKLYYKFAAEDILLVFLTTSNANPELKELNPLVSESKDCHCIIDFANVEVLTSVSISNLLILRDILKQRGRRLIFSSVSFITKCVFTVTETDDLFEFINDTDQAIESLKQKQNL